ncbi:hypothetical protein CHS0354_038382 [Potamilus streckersoni]|uniref:Uncharacterized protein n=1 Tax=Potamilus streckersoni TaxID=2493646 RepID=A0AAE0VPJ5_9BIVA|nr:hypothetical protein CHS0354_038382 [Potamilus streckersoni]
MVCDPCSPIRGDNDLRIAFTRSRAKRGKPSITNRQTFLSLLDDDGALYTEVECGKEEGGP